MRKDKQTQTRAYSSQYFAAVPEV